MSDQKARRGRPKGTGVDDRSRLRDIAALISADPSIRPTTAIKIIGITDPSAVRRLRDKFHAASAELKKELAAAKSQPSRIPVKTELILKEAGSETSPPRKIGSQVSVPITNSSNPTPQRAHWLDEIPAIVFNPPAASWFASWCDLGFKAASQAVETQIAFLENIAKAPYIAVPLRNQLAFNHLALTMCMISGKARHVVH